MDPLQVTDMQFQKLWNKLTRLATQHVSPDITAKLGDSDRLLAASQAARILELEEQLNVVTEKTKALQKENQNLQKQTQVRIEPHHSKQNQLLIDMRKELNGCQQDMSRLHAELLDRKNGDDLMHSQVQSNHAVTEQLKTWLFQLMGQQQGETINLQNQITSLRAEFEQRGPHLERDRLGTYSPTSHPTFVRLDAYPEPQFRHSTSSRGNHMGQEAPLRAAPSILDLNKVARAVGRFDPATEGEYTGTFLDKVDHFLNKFPQATMSDRIDVLKASSTLRVCSFIDRQLDEVRSDYKALKQALIKEFGPPEAQTGLIKAMKVKQGKHEFPKQYYDRMRKSFFGSRNHPGCDEDTIFKTLFIHNLHFSTSRHLLILANPETMTSVELCDLAIQGFMLNKQANAPSAMPAVYNIAITHPCEELTKDDKSARPSPTHQWDTKRSKRSQELGQNDHDSPSDKRSTNVANHARGELAQRKASLRLTKAQARVKSKGSVIRSRFAEHPSDTYEPHQVSLVQSDINSTIPRPNPDHAPSYGGPAREHPNQQFLGNLVRKGPTRTLHLPVIVENSLSVDAVVDTGSDVTLMSSATFEEILMSQAPGKSLKVRECSLEIQGYAAVGTQLLSVALIHLKLGSMTLKHEVYVSALDHTPLLLGRDLLDRLVPEIDLLRLTMCAQVPQPLPASPLPHGKNWCFALNTGTKCAALSPVTSQNHKAILPIATPQPALSITDCEGGVSECSLSKGGCYQPRENTIPTKPTTGGKQNASTAPILGPWNQLPAHVQNCTFLASPGHRPANLTMTEPDKAVLGISGPASTKRCDPWSPGRTKSGPKVEETTASSEIKDPSEPKCRHSPVKNPRAKKMFPHPPSLGWSTTKQFPIRLLALSTTWLVGLSSNVGCGNSNLWSCTTLNARRAVYTALLNVPEVSLTFPLGSVMAKGGIRKARWPRHHKLDPGTDPQLSANSSLTSEPGQNPEALGVVEPTIGGERIKTLTTKGSPRPKGNTANAQARKTGISQLNCWPRLVPRYTNLLTTSRVPTFAPEAETPYDTSPRTVDMARGTQCPWEKGEGEIPRVENRVPFTLSTTKFEADTKETARDRKTGSPVSRFKLHSPVKLYPLVKFQTNQTAICNSTIDSECDISGKAPLPCTHQFLKGTLNAYPTYCTTPYPRNENLEKQIGSSSLMPSQQYSDRARPVTTQVENSNANLLSVILPTPD